MSDTEEDVLDYIEDTRAAYIAVDHGGEISTKSFNFESVDTVEMAEFAVTVATVAANQAEQILNALDDEVL